jgi:hypothetical protein
MNKRIQKKVAKREAEHATNGHADVGAAFQQLEKDVAQLANALLSEGRDKKDAALAEIRARIGRGETAVEQLLEKMPGVGPKLAEMLHAVAADQTSSKKTNSKHA